MLATLLTFSFAAAALLAAAVIAASVAKGFAAAAMLRDQLAACSDTRTVTVRHSRIGAARQLTPVRVSRRTVRAATVPAAPARQRAVA